MKNIQKFLKSKIGADMPVILIVLLVMSFDQSMAQVGEMDFPEGKLQHVVLAEDIQWKPCPTNLPEACEIAVLEGNPKAPDLFTVRFKVKKGFKMPPHTHPKDERVTVISGKVSVAFGPKATHDDARHFGPGDYYVNARNAVHTVWADSDCILQITGIGPWEANFVQQ